MAIGDSSVTRRSVDRFHEDLELKGSGRINAEASDKMGHDNDKLPAYEDDDVDLADGFWGDTANDRRDMLRLGKKQEFKRNFGFWSAIAFVSVYMGTWEFVLVSLSVGFSNGGYAGLFWCFITTVTCYSSIVASLAEMESMAPTAGGQ